MSYWERPVTPSPVVPLLAVAALGWVICNEALMGWYKKATVLQETVAENAVALVLAGGFLLLAAVFIRSQSEVVIVPVALVLATLLIKNIMVALILLLLVAYFAGIYYYPPDRGYGVAGGCSGLGFYMLLLLCLVLCAMFAGEGVNWWIPGVLLAACLLCLNLFSGGQVLGYGHI
ncbi:hypothetical protein ABZP36_028443 [Zizania latifolia]